MTDSPTKQDSAAKTEASAKPIQVNLTDQVAIVTGASQGIGKSIALVLAGAGAKVACVARSRDKLAETAEAIRAAGGTAEVMACDVTDGASVEEVMEAVTGKWGRLDILVNNAGITRDTLIPRMSDSDWDDVINTNLRGTFLFTRAATRAMMQRRYGRIINISSVSGLTGNPGQSNYGASKAGIAATERILGNPYVAWCAGVAYVTVWHVPALYNFALAHEPVHIFQHLSFLVSATIFWWPVLHPLPERRLHTGAAVAYLFAAAAENSVSRHYFDLHASG